MLNRTGHDLVFTDNLFGVQAFVFGDEWEEINLGVSAGWQGRDLSRDAEFHEGGISFPAEHLDTKGHSEIRLLVVGYAEDTSILKAYGAYVDVEIREGSDPNPGVIPLETYTPGR